MANGEDTRNHPNRRVAKFNTDPNLQVAPTNWRGMSEAQKDDFTNYPGTLKERSQELINRGGRW